MPYSELRNYLRDRTWRRIATLASPYSQSLKNLIIGDFSRIGTPFTSSDEEEKDWGTDFVKTIDND